MTMDFFCALSNPNVEYPIDGIWISAFVTVKCKVPSVAAVVAVTNAKIATVEDAQGGAIVLLVEETLLKDMRRNRINLS